MKTDGASGARHSLSFVVNQSKSRILDTLEQRVRDYRFDWKASELSSTYIHYGGFRMEKDHIAVHRGRAGTIYIYLEEMPDEKTTITIQQEKPSSVAILLFFSIGMFSLLFYFNYFMGGESIWMAIVVTSIPIIIWVVILAGLFYLLGKVRGTFSGGLPTSG